VPSAVPRTKAETGSVASDRSGASILPISEPVATMTEALAPASAMLAASTKALRRASRSPSS
jgi:hypothetical protein